MQSTTWAERAQSAADSINTGFGRRLLRFIPGTWIASVARPDRFIGRPWDPWHYWWQAHYLDCLVDASWRQLGTGGRSAPPETPQRAAKDPATGGATGAGAGRATGAGAGGAEAGAGGAEAVAGGAAGPRELELARKLLRTIRIRNFFRFANAYYDDMAWLVLAAGRTEFLTQRIRERGLRSAQRAARVLGQQLASADTGDLDGGLFWNTKRDFKNTPATAPAALFFARSGERAKAQRLVDWLGDKLFDADLGLYLDGLRIAPDGSTTLVSDVWTYNQGPILGALLELGGEANLRRAEALIAAVDRRLAVELDGTRSLPANGDGDGGLFMGILARYLTVAAIHDELSETARETAARLVVGTAEALWAGAEQRTDRRGQRYWTFPMHPGQPASAAYPDGRRVELSTQLQAWMVFEFAHQLTR